MGAKKAALLMVLYAAVLVVAGGAAYALAPSGARPRSALIVPTICAGAMLLSAVLALLLSRHRGLGMIGIRLGLVLPLVLAGGIGVWAYATTRAVGAHREHVAEWRGFVVSGAVSDDLVEREAFFGARDVSTHDEAYLRDMLWLLTVASVGAFFAIRAARPKQETRT